MHRGHVIDFDEARGLGEVVDDASGERYEFHCIEIADGSRTIEADAAVSFAIRRKLGRVEAASIRRR